MNWTDLLMSKISEPSCRTRCQCGPSQTLFWVSQSTGPFVCFRGLKSLYTDCEAFMQVAAFCRLMSQAIAGPKLNPINPIEP